MNDHIFQPFTDRRSRDIRNALSRSLIDVLECRSLAPAQKVANHFFTANLAPAYTSYINNRLQAYGRVLNQTTENQTDPLFLGLILWDEQLFFEVHEVLERAWLEATGQEKLFYQAMIRAAGVYIKMEAGYGDIAERLARKALPVLEKSRSRLAIYFSPDLLLEPLQNLSSTPPQLRRGNSTTGTTPQQIHL